MKVGYIGLGALGSELAGRLSCVYPVCAWDINDAAMLRLRDRGASIMASPEEIARNSDIVLLCLPRSEDVRQVVFGPQGLAKGLGAGKLIIDQTSGHPESTRKIAEKLALAGVSMIDAAVSGNPQVVSKGEATLMVGGSDVLYERVLPVLTAISEKVFRCGANVGDGQAMKMVNNAMNAACRLGTLELAAMGVKAGLPLECIIEVLNSGTARNPTTEVMLPAIAQGRSSTDFALSLMLKDINQAVMLGITIGVSTPVINAVQNLLQMGANTLGGQARLEDMVGFMESAAGTKFRAGSAGADVVDSRFEDRGASGNAELASLLNNAVTALCETVTYEGTALGFRFGLGLEELSRVINISSGRSAASERILPTLGKQMLQADRQSQLTLAQLQDVAKLAITTGVPTTIFNTVRTVSEATVNPSESFTLR
ncbi:putative NAD-binding 6-phosphopgluconate dehydrogenase [Advenella mimigardefordensis DPN7]|uniref:Putative NAD-binding 6-phosphopgluconate dehydrogenase n=2 Tax=Advenella mimigardefordensis TaxID=302406 RepID=W0PBJ4_ADVMD|nr:putative NAD-binding 6-phosphopgluconate dehydrogenase [Advenella mimigardefordensis DPN7]